MLVVVMVVMKVTLTVITTFHVVTVFIISITHRVANINILDEVAVIKVWITITFHVIFEDSCPEDAVGPAPVVFCFGVAVALVSHGVDLHVECVAAEALAVPLRAGELLALVGADRHAVLDCDVVALLEVKGAVFVV